MSFESKLLFLLPLWISLNVEDPCSSVSAELWRCLGGNPLWRVYIFRVNAEESSFNVMWKCVIQYFKRGVKFYWSLKIKLVEREKCFLRSPVSWVLEFVSDMQPAEWSRRIPSTYAQVEALRGLSVSSSTGGRVVDESLRCPTSTFQNKSTSPHEVEQAWGPLGTWPSREAQEVNTQVALSTEKALHIISSKTIMRDLF